jgi:multidrug efflux pump subunit AcrA (membrane-fusion protein)
VLKRAVQVDAVFEAMEMQPVKIEPKGWMDFTVTEAVRHGARVRKGDILVKVDTEKLEEQIRDLEQDQPGASTALEIANSELANLTQATPQKLEAARRSRRVAREDYDYFVETGREQREKNARFNVKASEQSLQNATEELKQLEKMYEADDLVEETEEIILKRQRFAVEAAQFDLSRTKLNSERELNTFIPREAESLKAHDRDQDLALALAEETLPKTLAKKRLDVEKMKRDQAKSEKRLADLKSDLAALPIRAPIDGIVYYGACEGGKWTSGAPVAKKLVPGGKLTPFEVFMTIVNPHKLQLKAVLPETDLLKVEPGLAGEAAPVSAPDRKLPVKVESLDPVPLISGGFELTLSVTIDTNAQWMPGMNCKVSLSSGQKPEVLLAPKEAVFQEGEQKYVYLQKSDGKPEKRAVRTGDSDDKMTEIVSGVDVGDKLLLKKPE